LISTVKYIFKGMKSKFLTIDTNDLLNGLIIAIFCTFITGFYQLIANGGVINWETIKPVIIAAIGAGVSYLTKNLLTNSKGKFMRRER
jgi:hypothetical protein